MKIEKTGFNDLFIIHPNIHPDQRGYFFESYNEKRFSESTGLNVRFIQDNESRSAKGVLRGLHYQLPPFAQSKLVRVIEGEVLDVVLDIRPGSKTFGKHFSLTLSGENKLQLFVPKGFAHGYVVISEYAIFSYKCDEFYAPGHEAGILHSDPQLRINWQIPKDQRTVSARDEKQNVFENHIPFKS